MTDYKFLEMCHLKNLLRIKSTWQVLPQYRHFSKFAPINIDEVKSEFRAHGNGSIDFTTDKNIGIITLNHPEKRNAISGKMMAEFHDLMMHLETRVNQVKDIKGETICILIVKHFLLWKFLSRIDTDWIRRCFLCRRRFANCDNVFKHASKGLGNELFYA